MEPNWQLLLHNINSIITSVLLIGLAFFTFLNGRRVTANIMMSMVFWGATIFSVSHLIGVNLENPDMSKHVLMLNLILFWIGAFQVHAVLAYLQIDKNKINFLRILYAATTILTIIFIFWSDLFLLQSIPKMYFTNYYVPGPLNFIRIIFLFGLCIPYSIYMLAKSIHTIGNDIQKVRQLKYLMSSIIAGYIISSIPNFLVFDIHIDPLFGMLFGVGAVFPFVYGAIKYEMFNVKIIAKQAFLYSIAVVVMGGVITVFNYSDQLIRSHISAFPVWAIPLLSSVIAITVGVVVWRNLREGDILKNEFISVVTHKFRTPLTHIKWASENITRTQITSDQLEQLRYIQSANEKLVELTDLLVNVSGTEKNEYLYKYERVDLTSLAKETLNTVVGQFDSKKFTAKTNFTDGLMVNADSPRIKFIMQTFIENAVHYTGNDSNIRIATTVDGGYAIFYVTDNGIGISKEELPLLFRKFYRGHKARLSDTEGMGIALFMSKEIIERHGGRIWAESKGENLGSTFAFSIPLSKK